jgi:hypothetical protein
MTGAIAAPERLNVWRATLSGLGASLIGIGLAGTVRPIAPGENGGVANGSFIRRSYSDLAVSAANSFGLFPYVLTIACRRASNRR